MVTAGPGPRGARALGHRTGISPDFAGCFCRPQSFVSIMRTEGTVLYPQSPAHARTHARIPYRLALACMHRSAGAAVGDGDPAALLHRSLERVLSVSLSIDEVRAAVRVRRRPTLRYLRTLTAPPPPPPAAPEHVAAPIDSRTARRLPHVAVRASCVRALAPASRCLALQEPLPGRRISEWAVCAPLPSLSSTAPAAFAIRGRRPAPSHAPTHAHPPARTHAD